MSTTDEALRRLERAFVAGVTDSPGAVDEWRAVYAPLVIAAVGRSLPPGEVELVDRCTAAGNEGLQAAQRGDTTAARRSFEEAWTTYRGGGEVSRQARLHIEARLDPMEAYLDYCVGDTDLARQRITRASSKDEILVQEYGHAVLCIHRLQLALNLLRIIAAQGDAEGAVRLGGALLDYIEHRADSLDAAVVSARDTLDTVPAVVVSAYFDKVSGEALLAHDDTVPWDPLSNHAEVCGDSAYGRHAHEAIAARAARLAHHETFVDRAVELMAAGRQAQPLLWFATVIDAIVFCRGAGNGGRRLASRLTSELLSQSDAPRPLRHAIEQSERSVTAANVLF